METPPPDGVDERELASVLRTVWGLTVEHLAYQPKGAGSYHWAAEGQRELRYFVTVDDLDTKPWISNDREETFAGLCTAYGAAATLRSQAGLAWVVAPLPARDGSLTFRLSPQHTMAVFPFVQGVAGTWGEPITDGTRSRLLQQLASLHLATTRVATGIAPRGPALAERGILDDTLHSVDAPWTGGPFSERARAALAQHADSVLQRLSAFDQLARELSEGIDDLVITHGEPHPGNLIDTGQRMCLIDWDTVALARPERDLWMLDATLPDAFAQYTAATGRVVSPDAISFYRLMWTLSDIAWLTDLFRFEHPQTDWTERKWEGLQELLDGGSSRPYGPP